MSIMGVTMWSPLFEVSLDDRTRNDFVAEDEDGPIKLVENILRLKI